MAERSWAGGLLVALLGLAAVVFLWDLGGWPLSDCDEAIYANLARHGVDDGYWLVPRTRWYTAHWPAPTPTTPTPFMEKPPLVFWTQMGSVGLLGYGEFAVRLPSALFAVATVPIVYALGRWRFGRRAGFFGALVWLTTPQVYAGHNAGRMAATDTALVSLASLAVYVGWRAVATDADRRWFVLAGGLTGLAFLTKGFAVGAYAPVALATVVVYRDRLSALAGRYAVTAGTAVAVAVPWPLYAYHRHGEFLVAELIGQQLGQSDLALYDHLALVPGGQFPYFKHLLELADPWVYVVPLALVVLAVRALRPAGSVERPDTPPSDDTAGETTVDRASVAVLGVWLLGVLAVFLRTGTFGSYILPIY
ncbi:hypothetical protein BRD17_02110, partial [Halobacteriales archaeon SW_7_68_16]